MALDKETIKRICDYVYKEPRTVLDIAKHIDRNWKTAERYVNQIIDEQGTLKIKTFRGGTRGALKIVTWNNLEKINSTEFQEKLFRKIESGRKKHDFSPMDIYQYVDEEKRDAFINHSDKSFGKDFVALLKKAKTEILCFSGNLSWVNYKDKDILISDIIEELLKRGVKFKIVSRVDLASTSNIDRIIDIQNKLGVDSIEIRHSEQPLRGFIIDNEVASLKEVKNPEDYKPGELDEKARIYYQIYDKDWILWMQKVFYNLFRHSIDHKKRLNDIRSIKA